MQSFLTIPKTQKVWILLAMSLCTSLIFLESTIFPVSLPTIQKQIKMGQEGLYWAINSYFLTLSCFIYLGGKLSDLFGQKKIFCLGMVIFALASLICALAPKAFLLILGRSVQGIGAALMLPASTSITLSVLDKNERGKGIGFLVAVSSVFLSLGPFLGGFFSEYYSWRIIFWINIPPILIGLLITVIAVPKAKELIKSFNFKGFITYIGLIIFLTMILMEIKAYDTSSLRMTFYVACFVGFSSLFALDLLKKKSLFFDYRPFKNLIFLKGNILIFIEQFLIMVMVFWSLFFQKILGYSPLEAGVLILITTLPVMVCAPLSGYFSDHFGPKWLVACGFVLSSLSFLWCLLFPFSKESSYSIIGLILFGCSSSIIMTPVATTSFSTIVSNQRGGASGIYQTLRNISSTISVAVLGILISFIIHEKFKQLVQPRDGMDIKDYKSYVLCFLQGQPLSQLFPKLSFETIEYIQQVIKVSAVTAFFWVHVLCFILSLVGFVLTFVFFNNKKLKIVKSY